MGLDLGNDDDLDLGNGDDIDLGIVDDDLVQPDGGNILADGDVVESTMWMEILVI